MSNYTVTLDVITRCSYTAAMREKRSVNLILRITPDGRAEAHAIARGAGKTLSEWLRGLMWEQIKAHRAAEKAKIVLPREKWCQVCGIRPLTATTFNPDCERCNRLQEELRR